jgi:pheromone shutdown-related protein TraB
MQISNLGENVDLIKYNDKEIVLVGSAHISGTSVKLAEEVIRRYKPQVVAVELCESRYKSLKDPERWKNTDIVSVIKEGRIYVLLTQIILASLQKKLGSQLNIKPGAEMLQAIKVAEELNCEVLLADREVKITIKRVWKSIGFIGTCKILVSLISSIISSTKINTEEIEKLKSEESLKNILKELGQKMPGLKQALIDERDQYLAAKICNSNAKSIVAIVGAGHIAGIKHYLDKDIDIENLESTPRKNTIKQFLAWTFPIILIAFFCYGYYGYGAQTSFEMIKIWCIITGLTGAMGAALALAHPITIISTLITTPLSTVIPLIPAGWFSGLIEAWVKKPRVSDFEQIADDLTKIKGIWTNRVSKIILIIMFTNTLHRIGMIWAASVIANLTILGK